MVSTIKLSLLAVGSKAVIRDIPLKGAGALRLREMGVLPGVTVTLVRTAPFGDPLEIQVRGYNLSLRKSEADHVEVEMLNG